MKAKGQETIDELIKKTTKSNLFLSLGKTETNLIHWLHSLDILDLQSSSQSFGSSTLDSALDFKSNRQQEALRFETKTGRSSDTLDSSVKSGNMLGRGLQSSGDNHQSLKFSEAFAAFTQGNKDTPGWPLMSNKIQVHKCEKCSQEFFSTLNQRRHMRAKHRRPLNGDKEDLKKKREQIAAFWDKLDAEVASEIISVKNLSLMELSAVTVVSALKTHQSSKVATALLDLVQNKSPRNPVNSAELFAILDDASEKNLLYGVTSSSMHRCIFDSEPARVGLETKNLVAALGFLVEYRLVKAWMDDKDVEALRCQKALVEEEEAAQKKRQKLLERKRQKKLRQKESKDKERKSVESSSSLQELKFGLFPREGDDSLTATQSSPSSSGYSGLESQTPQVPNDVFENVNKCTSPSNHVEDVQSLGDPDDLEENGQGSFNYASSHNLESQPDFLEGVARTSSGPPTSDGGIGWKDGRQADASYMPNNGRQPYSKDRRHYEYQYVSQRLPRSMYGNSAFEYSSPRYIQYREKPSAGKRPTPVAGAGYAVWTRKTPQALATVSQNAENGDENVNEAADRASVDMQSENVDIDDSKRSKGLSRVSSVSSDSSASHSSGSISARVGAEEQESTDGLMAPVTFPPQVVSAEEGIGGSGALVIGSVSIPLGDAASDLVNIDSAGCFKELLSTEGKGTLPEKSHLSHGSAKDQPHLSRTSSVDATTPRGATSYQSSVREDGAVQTKNPGLNVQSKPGVVKVWRPVTPGERNSPRLTSRLPEGLPEVQRSDATGEEAINAASDTSIQLQHHVPGSSGIRDTSPRNTRDHEALTKAKSTPVSKEDAASSEWNAYYSELIEFLAERWQKAISSPDIVCYNKLDDLSAVPSG